MKTIWNRIQELIAARAIHNRKNFDLAEVRPQFIMGQAVAEFGELIQEPDDPEELGDVLSILLHYAIKKGWTLEDLEQRMLRKLDARFTVPIPGG